MPHSEADCVCLTCVSGITVRPYADGLMFECTNIGCDHWDGTVVPLGTRPDWVLALTEVVLT